MPEFIELVAILGSSFALLVAAVSIGLAAFDRMYGFRLCDKCQITIDKSCQGNTHESTHRE